ncbi:MAG: Translation initiation factor IF-3 [Parcubacteria group bacterium GW2011_GWB1_41_6]|nr:MAG: Translation initiation factor IF-3 [Parcubacteria group bacterium GW2011_GWB1_41_6]KKS34688.1 MAG: Translation initiation factor IF-3 [Parcubacteria group bacterium GW2011_GWC2_42_13]
MIDETGKNLGILTTSQALDLAKEKELDLIEISASANPPVAKIMDLGKFQYLEERKERQSKKTHQSLVRNIRLNIGTSEHDLELKAKKASNFLKKSDRVKIELMLRGRAKYLDKKFLEERLKRILNFLTENYKVVEEPRKGPRGIAILIEKEK